MRHDGIGTIHQTKREGDRYADYNDRTGLGKKCRWALGITLPP